MAGSESLTEMQGQFVREYVKVGNPIDAFKAVYNAAHISASAIRIKANKLLAKPDIALAIGELNNIETMNVERPLECLKIRAVLDKDGRRTGGYISEALSVLWRELVGAEG